MSLNFTIEVMSRKFDVAVKKDEDYLIATVPALRGCLTQAKTMATLKTRIKEAIGLCIEEMEDVPVSRKVIRTQRIAAMV